MRSRSMIVDFLDVATVDVSVRAIIRSRQRRGEARLDEGSQAGQRNPVGFPDGSRRLRPQADTTGYRTQNPPLQD